MKGKSNRKVKDQDEETFEKSEKKRKTRILFQDLKHWTFGIPGQKGEKRWRKESYQRKCLKFFSKMKYMNFQGDHQVFSITVTLDILQSLSLWNFQTHGGKEKILEASQDKLQELMFNENDIRLLNSNSGSQNTAEKCLQNSHRNWFPSENCILCPTIKLSRISQVNKGKILVILPPMHSILGSYRRIYSTKMKKSTKKEENRGSKQQKTHKNKILY